MAKILVTGAGGFIGHHLTNVLVQQGNEVRGVDLKYPEFEQSRAQEFELLDLRRLDNCLIGCRDVEEIYHLASDMGGIGYITRFHADISKNNTMMNVHMLEASRILGVKRFLFSSSACVYPQYLQGVPDVTPLKEEKAHPADPEDFLFQSIGIFVVQFLVTFNPSFEAGLFGTTDASGTEHVQIWLLPLSLLLGTVAAVMVSLQVAISRAQPSMDSDWLWDLIGRSYDLRCLWRFVLSGVGLGFGFFALTEYGVVPPDDLPQPLFDAMISSPLLVKVGWLVIFGGSTARGR